MNNPATQQIQVLKTVAEWADQFTCIRKIHVFGSFARGEEFSDIDIAVDYIDDVRELKAVQCYTEVNKSFGSSWVDWSRHFEDKKYDVTVGRRLSLAG